MTLNVEKNWNRENIRTMAEAELKKVLNRTG